MFGLLKEILTSSLGGIGTEYFKKILGISEPPIIINNFFNIKKLEKIIINQGQEKQLRTSYSKVFIWLNGKGGKKYISDIGEDNAAPFTNYLEKLRKPENASISEMLDVFDKVKLGVLNWSIREKISGEKMIDFLKSVDKLRYPAEDEIFYEVARGKAIEEDKNLKEITENEYEELNIGGLIGFLRTNAQFSNREIVTPEFIGFRRVENKKALVNLAIKKELVIENVILKNDSDFEHYLVEILVKNNSANKIDFIIPKGQIFENKKFKDYRQSLASIEREFHSLGSGEEETFPIHSLCLNEKIPAPSYEGLKGNITIFEVADKSYSNAADKQEELWKAIRKNKSKLQFAKW